MSSFQEVFEKALANPAFCKKLMAKPRATLAEHGIEVPANIAVRIVPGEEDSSHLCPTCQLSYPAIDLVFGQCACPVPEPKAKARRPTPKPVRARRG